ncbi:MAG: hypothetical protein H0V73_03310 [Chloroflexi bacterium]|nr:hypothetical protein [Chloroflexota bacterium]
MIRNAVIHITNEQPLLADLYEMPGTRDVSLICTNVRMLDGKKPLFIDHASSVFVFPYLHIRFIEIVAAEATGTLESPVEKPETTVPDQSGNDDSEADLELDEDFLRRIREV